jgi:hypothetical protein
LAILAREIRSPLELEAARSKWETLSVSLSMAQELT